MDGIKQKEVEVSDDLNTGKILRMNKLWLHLHVGQTRHEILT